MEAQEVYGQKTPAKGKGCGSCPSAGQTRRTVLQRMRGSRADAAPSRSPTLGSSGQTACHRPAQSLSVAALRRARPPFENRENGRRESASWASQRGLWEAGGGWGVTRGVCAVRQRHSGTLRRFTLPRAARLCAPGRRRLAYTSVLYLGSSFVCLDFSSNISLQKDSWAAVS